MLSRRGHVYVEVHWPHASGRACWDTGSGATIVDRDFWARHPELFEQIDVSTGTDGHGEQAKTPLLLMAEPVIGQRTFTRHKAVAADLSRVNSTLEIPDGPHPGLTRSASGSRAPAPNTTSKQQSGITAQTT